MLSIKNHFNSSRFWISDLTIFIIIFGIFYFAMLGGHALFTPDEGRYSEVAREMLVSHDFITPRLVGVPFLDKPVLYYWLQASAIKLFGLTEWALRFWPAILGLFGCVMTYCAGRILFNRKTAILSSVILATCPLYYGAAHYANLDLEVAVFISSSLFLFLMGVNTTSQYRSYFLYCAYFFAGLAALTKGLIGIVFPMMIVGAWILLLNRWSIIKKLHLGTGIILFLGLTLPWYLLVQKENPQFFKFFFVTQQFSRFLTMDTFNNKVGVWFYFPIVLLGIFPWTTFVIQTLLQKIKNIFKDKNKHANELYFLLWAFLIFIFFSTPHSKTVGYILPIFPAIAVLIGNYLSENLQVQGKGILSANIIFIVASILLGLFLITNSFISFIAFPKNLKEILQFLGIVFVSSAFFVFLARHKFLSFFIFTITAILLCLSITIATPIINQKTIKPLAMKIKPLLNKEDEIVTYYKYYQDIPIYLEKRPSIVADWHATDIVHNDNWLREIWYGMNTLDTHNWLIDKETFWKRWDSDQRLFVFTDEGFYSEFKNKNPIKIGQFNNVILLTNKKIQ